MNIVKISSSGGVGRTLAIDLIAKGLNAEVCRATGKDSVNKYLARMRNLKVYCFDAIDSKQSILMRLKHLLPEEEFNTSTVFYTQISYEHTSYENVKGVEK